MLREDIKAIALNAGFALKVQPDGREDLHPYVYEFAESLIKFAAEQRLMDWVTPDNKRKI